MGLGTCPMNISAAHPRLFPGALGWSLPQSLAQEPFSCSEVIAWVIGVSLGDAPLHKLHLSPMFRTAIGVETTRASQFLLCRDESEKQLLGYPGGFKGKIKAFSSQVGVESQDKAKAGSLGAATPPSLPPGEMN